MSCCHGTAAVIPSFLPGGMQHAHDTQRIVAGGPGDLEVEIAADVIEKGHVRRSADRGHVQLHLDPADTVEFTVPDQPLAPFAIAFQKVASPGQPDDPGQGISRDRYGTVVPAAGTGPAPSQTSFDHPYTRHIFAYIFHKNACRHRFNRGYRLGETCSPDTERTDICPDINHAILWQDILEPVLRYIKDLAIWCWLFQERDTISIGKVGRRCHFYP